MSSAEEQAERLACARLCEELSSKRSFEIQLFAVEVASLIRARGVAKASGRVSLGEASRVLNCCVGLMRRLVEEDVIPAPGDDGLFDLAELQAIKAVLPGRLVVRQLKELRGLRSRVLPGKAAAS